MADRSAQVFTWMFFLCMMRRKCCYSHGLLVSMGLCTFALWPPLQFLSEQLIGEIRITSLVALRLHTFSLEPGNAHPSYYRPILALERPLLNGL